MNIVYAHTIIERRRKLDLKQADLAELAGISVHALSNMESGSGNPTISSIEAVLLCLGLELRIHIRELEG